MGDISETPTETRRCKKKRTRTRESSDPFFYEDTELEQEHGRRRMSSEKSPAAKLSKTIRDVTASTKIQNVDLDKMERSVAYSNATKGQKDQMRFDGLKRKSDQLQYGVDKLLEVNKAQAEVSKALEKKNEEGRVGVMNNHRSTNRNSRDISVIYKTLDVEAKRANAKSVKISGLELEYAYGGNIGTNVWATKGNKLLQDLKIPQEITERDAGHVQLEWGFKDEPVIWGANNQMKSRRSVDQQKKTIIYATFSSTHTPDWLTSRAGIESLKALKTGGQYSKFLAINRLLGPGGELMTRFVQDTRANILFAQSNKGQEFPELAEIDRIYIGGGNNQILKLLLKQKSGQKKEFIKVQYDDLMLHPLTKHHTPSFSGDPKRKRPQPINISGRAGVLRKRKHEVEEGQYQLVDEELLEGKLSQPKNATPYEYRPHPIPSNTSEHMKGLLNRFNEEARERHRLDDKIINSKETSSAMMVDAPSTSTSDTVGPEISVDSSFHTFRTVSDGNRTQ